MKLNGLLLPNQGPRLGLDQSQGRVDPIYKGSNRQATSLMGIIEIRHKHDMAMKISLVSLEKKKRIKLVFMPNYPVNKLDYLPNALGFLLIFLMILKASANGIYFIHLELNF